MALGRPVQISALPDVRQHVHFGLAEQRVAERAAVLTTAYAAHPERFPAGRPRPAAAPTEVWINPPKPRALEEVALTH